MTLKKIILKLLLVINIVSYGQENLTGDYYSDELHIKFVDSFEPTWQKKKELEVNSVDIIKEFLFCYKGSEFIKYTSFKNTRPYNVG